MTRQSDRNQTEVRTTGFPSAPKSIPSLSPSVDFARRAGAKLSAWTAAATLGCLASAFGAEAPAQPAQEETLEMSVFVVSGAKDEGYRSTQTVSGSRTVEDLKDIANSISIYNRELIDDLQVTTIAELSEFGITGERNPDPTLQERFVFRGVVNNFQLRDGFIWYLPVDTFSIERVELLRGPNAFLYGEAGPTGSINQMTKRATTTRDFATARLTAGSYGLLRSEGDINRRIGKTLAVRANVAWQDSEGFQHHVYRRFKGLALAGRWQPFRGTSVDVAYEGGTIRENRAMNMLSERFTTTALNNTTASLTNTAGGVTLVPSLNNAIYEMTGTRVSTGLYALYPDEALQPRWLNTQGPDLPYRYNYHSLSANIEQRVGKNLTLQAAFNWQESFRYIDNVSGTGSRAIYLDVNPTLPGGAANPNFGKYYTEYYHRRTNGGNIVRDVRLSAVYDLKLPFTTQRLIATGLQHQDNPFQVVYSEYVDATSASFKGSLINANTLAAFSTNTTTLTRNYFYRRLYLADGDAPSLTAWNTVPGRSVMRYDPSANGTAGRTVDRRFYTPAYGFGSSGSYFGGRVRTMVGWRHDAFNSNVSRSFYNPVTNEEYRLAERPMEPTDTKLSAYNLGGVWHMTKWVSPFFNWAESYSISYGIGSDTYKIGTVEGLQSGDGFESGLRWSLLDGKLESNWTYYETDMKGDRNEPSPDTNVKNELAALFSDFNTSGRDLQTVRSKGYEFETLANLTRNWTLTFNFGSNKVVTSETLPFLRGFQARARQENKPTPLLDAFLDTVKDGTPLRGYTKLRGNLITRYTFTGDLLKGLSVGGGAQYRHQTFLGNLDMDRDGSAEMIWAPGYTVWNLFVGYSTKVWGRNTSYQLGVANLFDKDFYRANTLNAGSWNPGRTFRFSATVRF